MTTNLDQQLHEAETRAQQLREQAQQRDIERAAATEAATERLLDAQCAFWEERDVDVRALRDAVEAALAGVTRALVDGENALDAYMAYVRAYSAHQHENARGHGHQHRRAVHRWHKNRDTIGDFSSELFNVSGAVDAARAKIRASPTREGRERLVPAHTLQAVREFNERVNAWAEDNGLEYRRDLDDSTSSLHSVLIIGAEPSHLDFGTLNPTPPKPWAEVFEEALAKATQLVASEYGDAVSKEMAAFVTQYED